TLCSHPVHLRRPRYLRMNVSRSIALAVLLALTTPVLASAQPFDVAQGGPAARQISFADVAAAVVQSNFQLRAAARNAAIAQASFNRTRQQLIHSAEQIYLQGLLANETVAAARRALDAASESLRVARVRFSAGAAAQFDVLQAEVAIANAEQTLVQAQTGVANAAAGLNAALSLPLDTPVQFTGTLTPRPVE